MVDVRGIDMPYKMEKSNGGYRVTSPHGVKAKHSTKANAESQMRLLRGIEHGWRPTGKGAEYSNKHAGAHANKEMHGQLVHGKHKACS